jgi:hypothetical protein
MLFMRGCIKASLCMLCPTENFDDLQYVNALLAMWHEP